MQKTMKQKGHHSLATIVVALLLVCTLTVTAFATANLTNTIGVTGLIANSSGENDWTAKAGGATWSGTSSEKTGCDGKVEGYNTVSGQLVLKNTSGSSAILTFDYTSELNGGSLTVDNTAVTNGSFNKLLDNNASVTISVTSSGSATTTAEATISNIKLEAAKEITLTFAPASNGSYTMNGTAVTANTVVTNINTVGYSLEATPASGYFFDGWYLGNTKVSGTAIATTLTFAESGTVTASFLPNYMNDPLYKQAKVPADSAYTKDQLVDITSVYFHDSTNKLEKDAGFPGNNTAYSKTATSGTKDKIDVQYIPSLVWNDSMQAVQSGTAYGDYKTGYAQESFAYIRMMSDVIRIYAKENCNVSFNYSNILTTSGASEERDKQVVIYTYISTAANATIANVKGGTKLSEASGSSGTIALSKGEYLYILAEGYVRPYIDGIFTNDQLKADFNYSASISDFTVKINQKEDVLTAGFRDNTGKTLTTGTINVNNVGQTIASSGNMENMTFVDLAQVELKVGIAPANYTHIGWEITPKGGTTTRQYTSTYTRTLTEDVTVNALFVPKTTITMGENGYADATYKDFNGNALNGQYVARNADCTAYYTSLADAFSKTNTVVLLAGATIEGDWTIPSGKTFVIPFGMNDAGSTTPAYAWGMGTWDYCLVNLNGNLTVNGTLIVNGQQNQSTGAVGGNPGHLVLASGKTITVNGSLYAYGPVTGDGKVEAASTAKIHETLEFSDNTVVIYVYNIYMDKGSKKVFPFNTMFANSIEIPVTYQQGATLTGHVAISYHTICATEVPIIAPSGAMMNHTAGTVTKYYDKNAGQFVFRFDEGSKAETGSFSITMDMVIGTFEQTVTMNTKDFYLPFSAPYRFEVAGDLTINGKYKLLPGMMVDVKESGKLTVADNSELVFYRRNDYDYRGKHGNSTEQWGYSERAYPVNPQRFNGVNYPFSFDNTNMGSAKLNVDGELIVNGGLYVTDEVQTDTANGLTLTADGYNYLTGTGKIDMTNADIGLKEINEVMRASGTNDLAWDAVSVKPLKGLKLESEQYEPLSHISHGVIMANGLNIWCNHDFIETRADCNEGCGTLAPVAWIKNSGDTTYYGTLADAVSKYSSGNGYIQMQTGSIESSVNAADKTIYLDLNGQDITVTNFAVATLYGMDTATNGFDSNTADKYGEIIGTVTGTVAPNYRYDRTTGEGIVGKCYVAVKPDGGNLSFHRFDMGVKKYTFYKQGDTGALVFDLVFRGDDAAFNEIFQTGACITGDGHTQYTWTEKAREYSGNIQLTKDDFSKAITVKAAVKLNEGDEDSNAILGDKYFAEGIRLQALLDAMNNGGAG